MVSRDYAEVLNLTRLFMWLRHFVDKWSSTDWLRFVGSYDGIYGSGLGRGSWLYGFDNLDWASHVGEPSQYQRLFLGREDLAVVVGEWLDDCD